MKNMKILKYEKQLQHLIKRKKFIKYNISVYQTEKNII